MSSPYDAIRAVVQETGSDARVEVNQRALIDKILARYASAGAVYRELLQNSNDAEATVAELHFTTTTTNSNTTALTSKTNPGKDGIVQQVLYRNNGVPFRPQDWSRLQKIAEGNPDVSKVGAFGVGAYTMFSICEEPLVISGTSSLCFVWKGDALWCKTAPLPIGTKPSPWTSFVLPSRDPYPLPDLIQLGEFLCASLTFTKSLKHIRVLVNDQERLAITKTLVQEPRLVVVAEANHHNAAASTPSFSWLWSNTEGKTTVLNTSTPQGIFTLARKQPQTSSRDGGGPSNPWLLYESIYRLTVQATHIGTGRMDDDNAPSSVASFDARYVTATIHSKIGSDMSRRMERVTKKLPPQQLSIQLFLNATSWGQVGAGTGRGTKLTAAERILHSFTPKTGAGRIFIGFRTSQTTGLAAHVAAPFIPTVEREAMDLQDPTLRVFNLELLEMAGILLRLTLEHTMYTTIDTKWKAHAEQRAQLEHTLLEEQQLKKTVNGATAQTSTVPNHVNKSNEENDGEDENDEDSSAGVGSGLLNFARFMARGVKKRIVSVVNTVEEFIDDGPDFLNPCDPRPLAPEEEEAIILMQSFCPTQSTPDPLVGTALARGFVRCLPDKAPPVLTRTGVMRGEEARLPNHGIEAFVKDNVVRRVVFQNCEEYHLVIASCRKVCLNDLLEDIRKQTLSEDEMIFLIKWLCKYRRVDPSGVASYGLALKEAIKFLPRDSGDAKVIEPSPLQLGNLLFYVEKGSLLANSRLPLPEAVLPIRLQERIGASLLADQALELWFNPLPMEVWLEYISHHRCITDAKPEDENIRVDVLAALSKEFSRRSLHEREVFGSFCSSLLSDKRCMPFDSDVPVMYAAERPSDLYLYSADLTAFEGLGSFFKAAASLKAAAVSEEFLLSLGVRKSVSIDFLFTNLDSLKWSSDPKPLIEYLRSATLTNNDRKKLISTQYLPASDDDSRLFAPSELYLPSQKLKTFPFVRMLRWPSAPELSEQSDNGKFLTRLGMKSLPPLSQVLQFLSSPSIEYPVRIQCFDFLCDRLGPHGAYQLEYSRLDHGRRKLFKFVPCTVRDPFSSNHENFDLFSTVSCFSAESCGVMGFPVLDSRLGKNAKLYGSILQCPTEPQAELLVGQLLDLVSKAKSLLQNENGSHDETTDHVISMISQIFHYLSHRASELTESAAKRLQQESFIPCIIDSKLRWLRPDQVYFRSPTSNVDKLTDELFHTVDFCPFLAAVGVKQDASTKDLFELMVADPGKVLNKLGCERKYLLLLRRIASNPPFRQVSPQARNSPFLLAYRKTTASSGKADISDTTSHRLAKAEDIFIIDNSFFGRMFPVDQAPHESDLEEFYVKLGSRYISKSVERRFEVVGKPSDNTDTTRALKERLIERGPLLVSPSITTRSLVDNAASVLSESNMLIYEASSLIAVYTLAGSTRRNPTTCFARPLKAGKNSIFVVANFDWFDVGNAIGDLLLTRCQLEDAFFISSILEAPLEQLRARGFPVDRIIRPDPPLVEESTMGVPGGTESSQPILEVESEGHTPSRLESAKQASRLGSSQPDSSVSSNKEQELRSARLTDDRKLEEGAAPDKPNASSFPTARHGSDVNNDDNQANGKCHDDNSVHGMHEIIMQMFPSADQDFVRSALGNDPTMEDVRLLAEQMSSGQYPRADDKKDGEDTALTNDSQAHTHDFPKNKKVDGLRKRLGRALVGGRRGNKQSPLCGMLPPNLSPTPQVRPAGASKPSMKPSTGIGGSNATAAVPSATQVKHENARPVAPAIDAQSQNGLAQILEQTVHHSAEVPKHGISSSPTTVNYTIPEGLDRGDTCEVIPGHNLEPYFGFRGDGQTLVGIRVFASRAKEESRRFLLENEDAIEKFGLVLERLGSVYGLAISCIAIYHDPIGQTIAFNSNRSLHFNIRFFYSLHYLTGIVDTPGCYAYWYVTMAHELAHHLVSSHNKEHGFYTESYTSQYLPKLFELLQTLSPSGA